MPEVARVGDQVSGTCTIEGTPTPFSGTIQVGSPTMEIDSQPVARIGDSGSAGPCGTFTITEGSEDVKADEEGIARKGDSVTTSIGGGTGTIQEGSDFVLDET